MLIKRTILFPVLLIAVSLSAQDCTWKEFSEVEHFYGSYLSLYCDSTYLYRTGGENSTYVSFGKWKLKEDIIHLTAINPATYDFVHSIRNFNNPDLDSIVEVKIIDRNGKPIWYFHQVLVPPYISHSLFEKYSDHVDIIASSHMESIIPIATENNGIVQFPYCKSCNIKLISLSALGAEEVVLPVTFMNSYEVRLNTPGDIMYVSNDLNWLNTPSLKVKNDTTAFIIIE